MRVLRNPVVQFLGVGLLVFIAVAATTTLFASRAANDEAITDARATTRLLARSVIEPSLTRGLIDGDPRAVQQFDRELAGRIVGDNVRRIKLWRSDGTIVYSDRPELIGTDFGLDSSQEEILFEGGIEAELSDLSKPENQYEEGMGGIVEVYTQVKAPDGQPLLFEAYYLATDIRDRQQEVFVPIQRIAVGGLLALLVIATPIVWLLTRRLTVASRERERLLVSAIDASAAERRRIARDLHDGVVQDLAGTTFSISALSRDPAMPSIGRTTLEQAGQSLRSSLRSLRSLLVEIHPPDLRADGLPAALEDLTAPASSVGIATSVSVAGVDGIDDRTSALVWRVAQEAVRNAIRHASAENLSVSVRGDRSRVRLDVVDDGTGFDPDAATSAPRFGLRGLVSLVSDSGGELEIRSAPGEGTTVHLEVSKR